MLKSLSESLRSLWFPRTDETVQKISRKRKRPSYKGDEDDSDVEVVSVKIPKKENPESSFGLLSVLKIPMSKMSEWVKRKTVRQDHFFVRPVPADSHWCRKSRVEEEQEASQHRAGELDARNGPVVRDCLQEGDRLSRPPVHSRNGTHTNGMNHERGMREEHVEVLSSSAASSRRSSCSSSRPGMERQTTVDKCFHLREREDYLKLLQQFTTVDLGYHGIRNDRNHYGASRDETRSRRKSGLCGPVPSTQSSVFSSVLKSQPELHPPITCFAVTPSRLFQASSLPSEKALARPNSASSSASSSSSMERFIVPHQPGRALRVKPTPRPSDRMNRSLAHGGKGASQHLGMSSSAFSVDQTLTFKLDSDVDQKSEVADDSDVNRPNSMDQQLRATPQSDIEQRLRDTPVSESDQPSVSGGHRTSSVVKPPPGLNFKSSEYLDKEWLNNLNKKYASSELERQRLIAEAEIKKKLLEERREARLSNLGKKLEQQMTLFDQEPEVIEERPLPEVPQEKPLPELTDAMQREIQSALAEGPSNQVLVEGFRLQIKRDDIATLRGLTWLNDEVINFYMNMLMERGEQEGFRKTYAFNTFFYPKLQSGGHAAVKRWTRKVDIFAYDYLIIPVHLGVHWCLCMVFVKEKKICYYDSMGGNNNQCLNTVRQYLADESTQKRNVPLDMSDWTSEIVKNIPQQMNGSDCGMFTCMYAETLTRGEKITFTQKDMPYFRRRMVYEILKKKLL